jgi:DNA-binding response OmpR family regulator
MKLLIIEDNPDIVANLYEFLVPRGYALDNARTAAEGLLRAAAERFDAIVVDVMLPGSMDGFTLCARLRRELRQATPVLILTARDSVEDKLLGFESGADDYLVKPFSMVELDARVKALVRRATGAHAAQRLAVGELIFDLSTFELSRAGTRLELTPTSYKLLACLMRAAPRVVTREELESAVWGEDRPDGGALRTHLHALRQVIDKPFSWPMLKTIVGVGLRLVDQP